METLIKDKVAEFTIEVSNVKTIKLGSDEHLDVINVYRKPIVFLTLLLSKLNKNLNGFYNSEINISVEDLKLLSTVNTLNSKLYASKKKSKHYPFLKEALAEFDEERQITKEIVHDFKEFRTNSEDFKKLGKRLKSL
jgi:hypothetical protein